VVAGKQMFKSLALKYVNVLCAAISMETGIGSAEAARGVCNHILQNKTEGGLSFWFGLIHTGSGAAQTLPFEHIG